MQRRPIPPWPKPGEPGRLCTLVEVLDRASVSGSTWARMDGTPAPVAIADRSLRFWTSEIDDFLAALPRKPAKPVKAAAPVLAAPELSEPPRRTPRPPGRPRKHPLPQEAAE
jgi:hypothetical protein